ncbi:NfeD family protein [Clostridium sp. MSJ-8]|uniref:NfeD family protein n=1 Tax=Clostridium sp. MSJ-8 TaxID=2841510 RepID=UPI001C0ECC34|nr:NfeD family protein [Clostridium sp. MSJ-8]MBU5487407.1 NfeD family protein [Clostridium sp. MSJ-8]
MDAIVFWLIVAVVVIVVDLFTSTFIFMWLSVGAIASIICEFCGLDFSMQFIAFAVVSLISILIGYPLVKRKFKKDIHKTPLMEESYIGQVHEAEDDIIDMARIKIGGIYWTGVNRGEPIKKGDKFEIVGIEGNKFIVEKCKEDNE